MTLPYDPCGHGLRSKPQLQPPQSRPRWRLHPRYGLFILFIGLNVLALTAGASKHDGLFYETSGRGRTVVLIHGGQMDGRMWDAQFEDLARRYQVIRLDLRGFGKSDPPRKPYSHL